MDRLHYLATLRGEGTSVITWVVTGKQNIGDIRSRLNNEMATAGNIRDRTNRHSVTTALKAVSDILNGFRAIPDSGLAIFSGACV